MPLKNALPGRFFGGKPPRYRWRNGVHLRTMNFLSCSIFTCDKTPQALNHAGYSDREFSAMKVNRKYQFT
jgi:hypothetical protein